MKKIQLITFLFALGFLIASCSDSKPKQEKNTTIMIENLYNIKLTSLSGEAISLSEFKGKKILFVNVASKCGFTPQYEGLQQLHAEYKDKLVIIGLPCNQFGEQEPGSSNEIGAFCQKNYGVDFLMTEKIEVKGEGQHPLYQWLTDKDKNGVKNSDVKWNFQKYLIDEDGNLIDVFMSTVKPMSDKIVGKL